MQNRPNTSPSRPLKIAIVDDEKEVFDDLKLAFERFTNENGTRFELTYFSEGLAFLEDNKKFDIVLMDIELPTMNGMTVAEKLREVNKTIILVFITKTPYFAINGYSVGAIDYVLKPVKWGRFSTLIKKIEPLVKTSKDETISIKTSFGIEIVNLSDIVFIVIAEHLLSYRLLDGRELQTWGSLKEIETTLEERGFARINKNSIVNMAHITTIDRNDAYLCKDKYCLPISQQKKKPFIEKFTKYKEKNNFLTL